MLNRFASALRTRAFSPPKVHLIDAMWCDAHGVFVKGWVHAFHSEVKSVSLRSGAAFATDNELHDRPDLKTYYPDLPSTRCGFSIYLACAPFRPVFLEFQTQSGLIEQELTPLPDDHFLNALPLSTPDPMPQFIEEMKARKGVVVEVGARVVGPGQTLKADLFRPECKFIGVDIHEAPGVDIQADAHFLGDYLPRNSVDGLFSLAVMEHIACPWLFAGQINKVLKVGGLTLHAVPHSFPVHEVPNDFWRMSDDGLKILFSRETGFETVASGMSNPVKMFVHPFFRQGPNLETAIWNGMFASFILARKIADIPDDAVKWPLARSASFDLGRTYPSHQKAPETPAEPIVFDETSATMGLTCPVCAVTGPKKLMLTAQVSHKLYKCDSCGSAFFHPFPEINYEEHTPAAALRDYVEMNASVDFPARNLLRLIAEGQRGKLIDVGCGFGFALDVVRTLSDWEVKGFEPSQYGAAGRDQLGLDIVQKFAGENDSDVRYDIVYCSEVIEHVHDGTAFLNILISYLANDGVLAITSPNPDSIVKGKTVNRLMGLLSPEAHTILFSDRAMVGLFHGAGLPYTLVDKTAETTLYYASRRPITLHRQEVEPREIMDYFSAALDRARPGSPLEIGLRYRLFRMAVDHALFDQAAIVYRPELAAPDAEVESINDIDQFAERWPFCIAASTYYCGMYLLLGVNDYDSAAEHFNAAHRLCLKKLEIAANISVVEADLVWRAKYHEALSLEWGGRFVQAVDTVKEMLLPNPVPPIPLQLIDDVANLCRRLKVST